MDKPARKSSPTIVGGQPVGKEGGLTGLPHGIESIVLLAAADESFRKDFSKGREAALRKAEIRLTHTEESILEKIRDRELFAIANSMRKTKPKGAKRVLMATAASLAALASLTTSAPKSRAADGGAPDQRPALGQFDAEAAGGVAGAAEGTATVTPRETPPTRGIISDTPTPTPTQGIRGIQPDTPTPTETYVAGIQPNTPTPTQQATATPLGIVTDTPTPNPADMNADGAANEEDLFLFLQQWYRGKSE